MHAYQMPEQMTCCVICVPQPGPVPVESAQEDHRALKVARRGRLPLEDGYLPLIAQGLNLGDLTHAVLGRPLRARRLQVQLPADSDAVRVNRRQRVQERGEFVLVVLAGAE